MGITVRGALVAAAVVAGVLGAPPAPCDEPQVRVFNNPAELCSGSPSGSVGPVGAPECCAAQNGASQQSAQSRAIDLPGLKSFDTTESGLDSCRGMEILEPFCTAGDACELDDAELTLNLELGSIQASEACCRRCLCFGDPECESFSGARAEWITCDGRADNCKVNKETCASVVDHAGNQCKWVGDNSGWKTVAASGSKCQTDFAQSGYPTMNMYSVPGFDLTLTLGERGVITNAAFTTASGTFTLDAEDCFKNDPRKQNKNPNDAWTPSNIPAEWSYNTVGRDVEIGWYVADATSGVFVAATCTRTYDNGNPGRARLNIDSVVETDLSREGEGFCASGVIEDRLQSAEDAQRVQELHAKCTPQNLPAVQIACQQLTSLSCNLWTLPSKIEYWCLNADLDKTFVHSKPDPVAACIDALSKGNDRRRAHHWATMVCEANQLPLEQCLSDITQFGWASFVATHSDGLINAGNAIGTCETSASAYGNSERGCDQGVRVEYKKDGVWVEEFFVPFNKPPCGGELVVSGTENPNLFKYPLRVRQCGLSSVCTATNGCAPLPSIQTSVSFDSGECPTPSPTTAPLENPTPEPTVEPTPEPTNEPTPEPTPAPTDEPTPAPTDEPTPEPTPAPTDEPTPEPTPAPTDEPTPEPTPAPTDEPTPEPTPAPTNEPTPAPTDEPTGAPTRKPTESPTKTPTDAPTESPTKEPTDAPTKQPTESPTKKPTDAPTKTPTESPTKEPTDAPTKQPTESPTKKPTDAPTKTPTESPTKEPTDAPTKKPTESPTKMPTQSPTRFPTDAPTAAPTMAPICVTNISPGNLDASQSPKFGPDYNVDFQLQLNYVGACDEPPRNVYQVGCDTMYFGVFVEACSTRVYAVVQGDNGELLEVCKDQMPELDLLVEYAFEFEIEGNEVKAKFDGQEVCREQFKTASASSGSDGKHTCVYRSSPDFESAYACDQEFQVVGIELSPICYECSVSEALTNPSVCQVDGNAALNFMECESCCLSESILEPQPDGPECRRQDTLQPFCDSMCNATCAPDCNPLEGTPREREECEREINQCTKQMQDCFKQQAACEELANPSNEAVLTLGIKIDTAAVDETCCASCACWGDPLCESFDGTPDAWVLCDSRNVDDCMVSEDLCSTQTDHLGNTCQWNSEIANQLQGRQDIQYFGSPCQPDWTQGDATMTMYKIGNEFEAELAMGERGVIEELRLKTDRGNAVLVADKCFDILQQKDVDAAFDVNGASSLANVVTAGYTKGPGKDEVTVTMIDEVAKIFIEAVCVRHQSSRATAYRLNVKHLIETNDVRLQNVEGEGFCVDNSIDKGGSTTDISTLVHDVCLEGLGDTVLLCKGIADASCTKGGLAQAAREWCATANVFTNKANSARKCLREIKPSKGDRAVYSRWVRLYCKAVSYQRAAGVTTDEFERFCVSSINNEGIAGAVEKWGKGAKPTGTEALSCVSNVNQYKVDLDPCSFGVAVEYYDQPSQEWVQSFFIPVNKPPCDDKIDIPYQKHPELFTNRMQFRQCDVDSTQCPLVASCQKAVGFDVTYLFQYERDQVCKDFPQESLPVYVPPSVENAKLVPKVEEPTSPPAQGPGLETSSTGSSASALVSSLVFSLVIIAVGFF